jgi:branched-chain amino acid transport system permease protein
MSRLSDVAVRLRPLLILSVLVVVVTFVVGGAGPVLNAIAINACVYLILVVGTYVFVGNSGIISFGQVAFAAIGAYASALLTMPPDTKAIILPDLPEFLVNANTSFAGSVLVAGLLAAFIALVLSLSLMRLSGIAAGIATFAVLVIVYEVLNNWKEVVGAGALSGIPLDLDLTTAVVYAVIVLAVAFWYQTSRWGLRLRGSREDEVAARASGINVEFQRGIAFVLSAAVMGVAGALYAHQQGVLSPTAFFLSLTFLTLAMLVIGGTHSLSGAVVGTFLLVAVQEVFQRWATRQGVGPIDIYLPAGTAQIVIALLMLVVVIRRPEGITGGREIGERLRRPSWRARRRLPEPQAEPAPES